MPWSEKDVDSHNKGLSADQKKQWVAVANSVREKCIKAGEKDCDAKAIRQANGVVANSDVAEFSLTIRKAYFDEATQEMRWRADTSDTETDSYDDNMTLELFSDFLKRIENAEKPPEHFCSDYWSGGTPYLSVSHYHDQNGVGVPGIVDAVYVDGNVLKAKGRYFDTPLGRACFKSVCESLHSQVEKPVRVSIAFLDYKHEHKDSGVIFERKVGDESCKECLKEALARILDGKESGGKRYLAGHLIHFAHTRVPVNKRTLMEVDKSMTTQVEDAASIVGEELAKELAEKEKELVGKSEATVDDGLVIKAEAGKCPKCGKAMKDGKCPECDAEEVEEGCGKKKKKADYDFDALEVKVDRLLSIAEAPKEVAPVHVLDETFAQFKSDFDSVMLADTTAEDKLQTLQASINAVGNAVVSVVRSQAKPISPEKAEQNQLSQLAEVVASLAGKVELLSTQIANPQVKHEVTQAVPQRRSLSVPPSLIAKKTESLTPTLHDIIAKSVY